MNVDIMIDFCKRLIKTAERKIYLIVDNLHVHHAKLFKACLAEHKEELRSFIFHRTQQELNPDEYLNCDLKAGVHSGMPARTKEQLKKKVTSHMRMLQRKPQRVKKYFEHRKINYAV